MDIDKDIYHSNGMLGLIPVVDESEAMSFHFGKLLTSSSPTTTTSDSKDFFNCDTSIGLEYPAVRSALQPICVHVDGAESTKWVNPPCDEHVDLLDISSKRLPVDLGYNNGLDKSSIYSSSINGSYSSSNSTPNNHVILNSLPASEVASSEIPDYYGNNNQFNESYNSCIRNDYGNQHNPFGEHEKIYYNGNQSLYSNGYHSQPYDHTNHHIHHVHHLANHQIYHNNNHHHHHHQHQQPTTPLHYQQQKRGQQQPFQRQYTHRRRLNLYEKTSPSPTKLKQKQQQQQHQHQQQQPQPPVLAQKPPKPQKSPLIQRPQKPPKTQHQKSQPQPQPPPPQQQQSKPKPDQKQFFIKSKQRTHVKSESKPELNQRTVLKRKSGRPRKYDYSPPKPTKFRSPRLRLRVQSEDPNSEDAQDSGDLPESERKVQEKVKKVKEVLPCDWVRPENLKFDRLNVSDYEKTSLPEFFAGKFDRTHFHPSQYLQIRNIFLDEWDKRKPNVVNFREMIRVHKGIGNVVSFSRVCKFLTAIGAINEISQDDDDEDNDDEVNDDDDDVTKGSEGTIKEKDTTVPDENQSKSQNEESEENEKDSTSTQSSPLSPSTLPTPPSSSPERQIDGLPLTQSDEKSCQPVTTSLPRRKGRKRKSYFLNEMSRLGIDPLSAGFRIPGYDKDRDKQDEDEDCEQTPANDDEDHNQSENEIIQN